MLHGWGLHSGIWNEFVPRLETRFRITCIDLPGHGHSEWQGTALLDDWLAAVLAVAPAPAAWVGWSLGGLLATRAAIAAPGNVTALVTLAGSPCFVRKPDWQSAMLPALLKTFSAELNEDYERTLTRFLSLQVRGSEHAGAVLKTLRKTLFAQGAPDNAALLAGLEILQTTDLRPGMPAIDCPILMIMGERDTLVPVNAGREAQELCRNARLEVIGGAGHAPFLAAPDVVAERINNFLS
jgi:pimeloyl-[acyl-carrier protein] methyl ester esterase